ncbi:putative T6SS immunity periplasmic lipoprotein [Pseudomonas sp. KNUC1026]|uniref:putative T6SS immunity periplasmic lipoprotein n=1 Tax=Pseudomonas sp. KNUC1026 TaxID=2893890 RepID=UPI003FA7DD12
MAGQCVPLLGFAFAAGHRYNLAVTVAVPDVHAGNGVDRGRFFSASFHAAGQTRCLAGGSPGPLITAMCVTP